MSGGDDQGDRAAYLGWLRNDRYDAVISSVYEVEDWNRSLDRPPEVAFFSIRRAGQQGVDVNVGQLIRSGFELLYVEMQQTLVERHDLPFRIDIPGRWADAGGEATISMKAPVKPGNIKRPCLPSDGIGETPPAPPQACGRTPRSSAAAR